MTIRLIQFACIAITAEVLWLLRHTLLALFDWGGPGFPDGFMFGALFVIGLYGIICWLDPSSRPRGNASNQSGSDRRAE